MLEKDPVTNKMNLRYDGAIPMSTKVDREAMLYSSCISRYAPLRRVARGCRAKSRMAHSNTCKHEYVN